MVELQIESIEVPLLRSGRATALALNLVARAQTMGSLPVRPTRRIDLDRAFLEELARLLRRDGVAAVATGALARAARAEPLDTDDLVAALRARDARSGRRVSESAGRMAGGAQLLGDDLLARLLGISASSLRRYAAGERQTPDEAAWRLHVVARLLAALVGSYGHGLRNPALVPAYAQVLDGASPAEVLERAAGEDDERLQRVLELAEELTAPPPRPEPVAIWFRNADSRWPFLWQDASQPPARWHAGRGAGAVPRRHAGRRLGRVPAPRGDRRPGRHRRDQTAPVGGDRAAG